MRSAFCVTLLSLSLLASRLVPCFCQAPGSSSQSTKTVERKDEPVALEYKGGVAPMEIFDQFSLPEVVQNKPSDKDALIQYRINFSQHHQIRPLFSYRKKKRERQLLNLIHDLQMEKFEGYQRKTFNAELKEYLRSFKSDREVEHLAKIWRKEFTNTVDADQRARDKMDPVKCQLRKENFKDYYYKNRDYILESKARKRLLDRAMRSSSMTTDSQYGNLLTAFSSENDQSASTNGSTPEAERKDNEEELGLSYRTGYDYEDSSRAQTPDLYGNLNQNAGSSAYYAKWQQPAESSTKASAESYPAYTFDQMMQGPSSILPSSEGQTWSNLYAHARPQVHESTSHNHQMSSPLDYGSNQFHSSFYENISQTSQAGAEYSAYPWRTDSLEKYYTDHEAYSLPNYRENRHLQASQINPASLTNAHTQSSQAVHTDALYKHNQQLEHTTARSARHISQDLRPFGQSTDFGEHNMPQSPKLDFQQTFAPTYPSSASNIHSTHSSFHH